MPVQFQSYPEQGRVPHVAVLPQQQQNDLGGIGELLSALGGIPAQAQQAEMKRKLNELVIAALSTKPTMQQTTEQPDLAPGTSLTMGGVPSDSNILTPSATVGDLFTKTPVTKTVDNPEYQDIMTRLSNAGPAFGMKFPTPIENQLAVAQAKAFGAIPLAQAKAEEQRKTNEALYGGSKSTLEAERQVNREKLLDKNLETKKQIADDHNQTVTDIANNKNLNDEQKIDKILKERSEYHRAEIVNAKELNGIRKDQNVSAADFKNSREENSYLDDLMKQRTQIDKIMQKDTSQPTVQTELTTAQEQYNALVDKVKSINPSSTLSKMANEDKPSIGNWLRSFYGGKQEQQLKETPNVTTPPPKALKPTTPQPITNQPTSQVTSDKKPSDFKSYDEYLNYLREKYRQ